VPRYEVPVGPWWARGPAPGALAAGAASVGSPVRPSVVMSTSPRRFKFNDALSVPSLAHSESKEGRLSSNDLKSRIHPLPSRRSSSLRFDLESDQESMTPASADANHLASSERTSMEKVALAAVTTSCWWPGASGTGLVSMLTSMPASPNVQ
jgi:hypothetical protein